MCSFLIVSFSHTLHHFTACYLNVGVTVQVQLIGKMVGTMTRFHADESKPKYVPGFSYLRVLHTWFFFIQKHPLGMVALTMPRLLLMSIEGFTSQWKAQLQRVQLTLRYRQVKNQLKGNSQDVNCLSFTLSLPSWKSTFSQPSNKKARSWELVV